MTYQVYWLSADCSRPLFQKIRKEMQNEKIVIYIFIFFLKFVQFKRHMTWEKGGGYITVALLQ